MNKRANLLAMAVMCSAMSSAQIVINEVMQSNVDCIMDDLNDFPDSWVELYNAGTEAVDLSAYSLGDTGSPADAWSLPQQMLAPKSYRLVYCDKEATGWHTAFRLESGKDCQLFLFRNGEIADQLPAGMKKQPAPNIAYGRSSDGSATWGYQLVPTPGAANCGSVCSNKDILGSPVFSIPGRVFSQSLQLALSLPADAPEGTEIRFTLDGSEPTAQSPVYSGPMSVSSTTVVRAKLFCAGKLSPRSLTHTYIRFDRDVTLPVVSVVTDKRYLTDDKTGIYVNGSYQAGRKNYEFNWRRPINIEYFGANLEKSDINQVCEARITGGASRGAALKSLGIYANKRFGEKRLSYEFFPDQRPGMTDFKSIMLRNAGNDFDYLYMRDAVIQRLMSSYVDLDWQAWSPAIFYLNGEYKGILNIRERSNENNIYTNYNGLEDIDMVENWWELKEGTIDSWLEFQSFYSEHGHTWAEYNERMDVQEFMDIMIMNLFFCNLDFPGNNIVLWRPQAAGGRWRVVVKDTDFGLGLYGRNADYKILNWLYNPGYDPDNNWGANGYDGTRLFRRLMEDATFYREFIDRFAIYMGDFLNFDRTWEVWQPMYEKVKYEYPYHRALYNRWWPVYNDELESAKKWLKDRVGKMYSQISDYYGTGAPVTLSINQLLSAEDLGRISVTFNGVRLSRSSFSGKFFAGRTVTLKGENVDEWEVRQIYNNGNSPKTTTVAGGTCSFTMPADCVNLMINAKPGSLSGISDTQCQEHSAPAAVYDLAGRRIGTSLDGLPPGLYISNGKKILKK